MTAAQPGWGAFREEQADLPTGRLTYHRGGAGRPLVYLHSAGGPRLSPVLEGLAARHEVHALTAPGFAGTGRHAGIDDIAGLAELVGAFIRGRFSEPVDVMGESFGGWLAMRVALRFPELVDHLVLEAPAGLRDSAPGAPPPVFARPERAPGPGPHQEANAAAYASYGGGRIDEWLADRLEQIEARTLVLLGTEDQRIPAENVRRIKAALPHCHLTYVYGGGHGLEYDEPGKVLRLVGDFLERGEAFVVPVAP